MHCIVLNELNIKQIIVKQKQTNRVHQNLLITNFCDWRKTSFKLEGRNVCYLRRGTGRGQQSGICKLVPVSFYLFLVGPSVSGKTAWHNLFRPAPGKRPRKWEWQLTIENESPQIKRNVFKLPPLSSFATPTKETTEINRKVSLFIQTINYHLFYISKVWINHPKFK